MGPPIGAEAATQREAGGGFQKTEQLGGRLDNSLTTTHRLPDAPLRSWFMEPNEMVAAFHRWTAPLAY